MKHIIQSDRLIDGSGSTPLQNGAIVIEGDKISKICTSNELTDADKNQAEVLSVPGGSILPGFIEMHSHIHCSSEADAYQHITTESNETFLLRGTQAVRAALSSGVTTMKV